MNFAANEICSQSGQPVILALRPAVFDGDVLALDVAGFVQALSEAGQTVSGIGRRRPLTEISDHRHRLLRTRHQPPCAHCAGKGNNEMASSHAHPLFQPPAWDYGLVGANPSVQKTNHKIVERWEAPPAVFDKPIST